MQPCPSSEFTYNQSLIQTLVHSGVLQGLVPLCPLPIIPALWGISNPPTTNHYKCNIMMYTKNFITIDVISCTSEGLFFNFKIFNFKINVFSYWRSPPPVSGQNNIKTWMSYNFVKLSCDKLEIIIISPKSLLPSFRNSSLCINVHTVTPLPSGQKLGWHHQLPPSNDK